MKLLPVAVVLSLLDWKVSAFVVGPPRCTSPFATIATASASSTTRLFLEDWVADMIDGELWRENHKAEFERAWMEKNRGAVLQSMNANSNHQGVIEQLANEQAVDQRQLVKDKKLAQSNPQQYCADRCIATGYCEVYEDM